MGCDIHAYLDVVEAEPDPKTNYKGYTSTFAGRIDLGRNYELFGLLAGVRGGPALYQPRGIPAFDEMGFRTRHDYWLQITEKPSCDYCGECQHVTPEQAEKWRVRTLEVGGGLTYAEHPDWHTPSWLYHHELEEVVKAYEEGEKYLKRLTGVMALMKALNGRKRKRSRLVFWFDN
jgi:hypothetical protein